MHPHRVVFVEDSGHATHDVVDGQGDVGEARVGVPQGTTLRCRADAPSTLMVVVVLLLCCVLSRCALGRQATFSALMAPATTRLSGTRTPPYVSVPPAPGPVRRSNMRMPLRVAVFD